MKKFLIVLCLILSLCTGCSVFDDKGVQPNKDNMVEDTSGEPTEEAKKRLTIDEMIDEAQKQFINAEGVTNVRLIGKLEGSKIYSDGHTKMDMNFNIYNETKMASDNKLMNIYNQSNYQQGVGYKTGQSIDFWIDLKTNDCYIKQDDNIWQHSTLSELKTLNLDLESYKQSILNRDKNVLISISDIFRQTDEKNVITDAKNYILKRKFTEYDITDLMENADILKEYGIDIDEVGIGEILQYKSKAKDGTIADMYLYLDKGTYRIDKIVLDYSNLQISSLITIREFSITFMNDTTEKVMSLTLPSESKNQLKDTLENINQKLEEKNNPGIENPSDDETDEDNTESSEE